MLRLLPWVQFQMSQRSRAGKMPTPPTDRTWNTSFHRHAGNGLASITALIAEFALDARP
jgi:hypothetical protein